MACSGACGRFTAPRDIGSLQRYMWPGCWGGHRGGRLAGFDCTGAGAAEAGATCCPRRLALVAVWLVLLVGSAALVLGHHDRFKAVVLTGVVGLVTALTFLALVRARPGLDAAVGRGGVHRACMLMGLALLPARTPRESSGGRRLRDAGLASVAGLGVAFLCWMVLTRDHDAISWYFLAQSVPGGGGTNVVNVTLVDFRGYDTFGEITVLGIAGVGVLAMLDGFKVRRPAQDETGRPWSFARQPLMLRVAARLILPMALVMSAYIFWRGHNLPGGGFIAGLITAVALVLQYMAQGQEKAEALLHGAQGRRFTRWIGMGLSIAGLTGVGALLWGRNFLTSAHGHPHVPGFGEVPLASAALFDLGVYITVVGATLLTLSVLGHASKEGRGATSAPVRSRA
jgi:multicomponent K+:H+ antiporter subunit A